MFGRQSSETLVGVKTSELALGTIRFYDWKPSPFCFKVRAVLDYKKLEYRTVDPIGGYFTLRRRGRIGKVPALDIDGEFVVDSTDIAHELERRFPLPAILPSAALELARCHVLEDWADEALYFIGLYYQWIEPDGRKMVPKAFPGLSGKIAYLLLSRVIRRQLRGHGTLRKPPDHVRGDMQRNLDAIEDLLRPGPFLLGVRPYLCDFALLGQLVYLARTPVGGKALEGREAIAGFRARMKALR